MTPRVSIVILLLGLISKTVDGAGLSGTEFWFGYATPYPQSDRFLRVAIVTEAPGIACIQFSNVTNCMNIEPGISNTYDIGRSMEGIDFVIENKGIMVNSTVEVHVFVLNYAQHTSDAFAVLPISQLSTTYILTTGPVAIRDSQILIVSPSDNNDVNITLETSRSFTYNDVTYTGGDVLRLQLNKFDMFQISIFSDLSGTSITSSNYVAVISGNQCHDTGPGACSHVTEMMLPIQAFSYNFIVPVFQAKTYGSLYVLASSNNTEVTVDDITYSINEKQIMSTTINVTTPTTAISSKSAQVTLTVHGDSSGDPFMITIPDVSQYRNKYNFIAFDSFASYVSIIIQESSNASNILLDGNTITYLQQSSVVMKSTRYTICTLSVIAGVHTMNHTAQETFGLFVYGVSSNDGYGYTPDINFGADACLSNPCKNNGTCQGTIDSHMCICLDGFTSANCETDIDECASNPCQNGATCNDLVNSFNCSCAPGYSGSNCSTDIDECASNPCQNGATCNDLVNSFNCSCAPGYSGTNCSTDIDECASNPCQNGATCNDLVNSFNCSCAPGYSGTNCSTDINECASNPCQNGATCNDLVNSFNCFCAPGYSDTYCSTDINECASNPCQNGATCNDLVNSFNCSCAPGYSDTNCSTEIDECASAPCQNGGTCNNMVNAFNCACPAGYSGDAYIYISTAFPFNEDASRGLSLEFTLTGEGYVIDEETRLKAIVLLDTVYNSMIVSVPWFISVENVSISLGSLIIAHTLVAREIPEINFIVAAAVGNITGREVRLDNESSPVVVGKVFMPTLNITADVSSTACDVLSIIQPCNSGEACYQDNVGIPVCSIVTNSAILESSRDEILISRFCLSLQIFLLLA